MSTNPIWIAGYGGPVAGASPVWIAAYGGTVAGASEAWIAGYGGTPAAGASPVWIAGYGGTPTGGASPIWIGGYLTAGGGGGGATTSLWSAADATTISATLTNGGLTVAGSQTGSWKTIRGTVSKSSGKLYVEFKTSVAMTGSNVVFGLASSGFNPSGLLSSSNYSVGMAINAGGTLVSPGFTANYSSALSPIVPSLNDIWAIAVDFTTNNIWLARNNVWVVPGNPSSGASPIASFVPATVGALFPALSLDESGTLRDLIQPQPQAIGNTGSGIWTLQATTASLTYTPPTGFKAWDAP